MQRKRLRFQESESSCSYGLPCSGKNDQTRRDVSKNWKSNSSQIHVHLRPDLRQTSRQERFAKKTHLKGHWCKVGEVVNARFLFIAVTVIARGCNGSCASCKCARCRKSLCCGGCSQHLGCVRCTRSRTSWDDETAEAERKTSQKKRQKAKLSEMALLWCLRSYCLKTLYRPQKKHNTLKSADRCIMKFW